MSRLVRFLIPLTIFFSGIIPIACGTSPEETAFNWQTYANAYGYGYGIDAEQ
jgi:hypothetical protein